MTLETVWFFLWALLWAMYFMTDGFDLGIGALMPWLAKDETEKRILYNATGPLWDGNEVWLITAGGATFAAFPRTYATMFSTFHEALTLLVLALIVRGLSFEYRSKVATAGGRKLCDLCQSVGSILVAVLLGVAFGNLFRGLPIVDGVRQGTILTLLNPYALAGGVFFLAIFLLHGSLWLALRTTDRMHEKATGAAKVLWPIVLTLAAGFLIYTAVETPLWNNYLRTPVLLIVPALAIAGLLAVRVALARGRVGYAWIASAAMIVATTFFGVIGMYPNMLASTIDPAANSVTLFNAASSPLTLKVMLGVVILFIPLVLIYQAWAYRLFSGKLDTSELIY